MQRLNRESMVLRRREGKCYVSVKMSLLLLEHTKSVTLPSVVLTYSVIVSLAYRELQIDQASE